MFSLADYRFHLPEELIAEMAAHPAHNAKLMIIDQKDSHIIAEKTFFDLPDFLNENNVLFFNNSRVLRARIPLKNQQIFYNNQEKNISDGEIFFLKNISENRFEALVRPGKKFKIGTELTIGNARLTVVNNTDTGRIFEISGDKIADILEKYGELPLPPYIEYAREKEADYQNVFANKSGSVASPTAWLHFTEELLEKISQEKNFVTLHIGLGTFKTIDTEDIRSYEIHSEVAEVEKNIFQKIFELKKSEKIITAIGTTACRTLESLPSVWQNLSPERKQTYTQEVQDFWEKISEKSEKKWIDSVIVHENSVEFATRAYITPWYQFAVINELITNFHLPESSLLVLVSAMIWQENLMKLYQDAIASRYRFFSFGDGMYLKK